MSFEYINKNKLNSGNLDKANKKLAELMKDKKWKAEWKKKAVTASNDPEVQARRTASLKKTCNERNWWVGRTHSAETIAKMKESAAKRVATYTNSCAGHVWIYNESLKISKSIKGEELNKYLEEGWLKGRKMVFTD